jgi:hypothetical protein
VAGMAVALQVRDDPAMSVAQMAVMLVLGGILVGPAVALAPRRALRRFG